MKILLITFIILTIIFIVIKIIWQQIEINHLYSIYGFETNSDSFEAINKEYYQQLSDHDLDEQVIYDVELHEIFDCINRTYTDIGREYLYGQFFVKNHDYELLESIIKKIKNEKVIKKAMFILFDLTRYYHKSLSLFDHIDFLSSLDMLIVSVLGFMPIVLVAGFFIYGDAILMPFFIWISIQVLLHQHYVNKTDNVMRQVFSYCHVVETLKKLNKLHLYDEQTSQAIEAMIKKSNKYTKIYRICMKIEKIDVYYFMELLYALIPIALFQCYIIQNHKNELKEDYIKMYEYVGMVDMALAISSLREVYQTCIPVQTQESKLKFQNIYHPILKEPVKNSLELTSSCMITGSNASGKSTFIKTVGLNMLMAKTMNTCFADEFIYYPYHLCTSIHMKDVIGDGDSYYVKEIKILKAIIDNVKARKCIVLIDEILRGTNEEERLKIARAVLNYLFDHDSLVIVTTHDITLVEHFVDIEQYSFHDYVDQHRLNCDYLIKKGVCHVGNAIRLLEVYHFDEAILKQLQ